MFGTGVTSELNVEDNFKIHKMGFFFKASFLICAVGSF